ncbi:HNH endonuclease signature motif containing protein [Tenacibaculum finnmarkense]|uniref:HNH endonuclease signature motif containing protein n=1 Tax=Tenacibaculum finnmarkense TaxID=2781243 RepID=UPI00207AFA1B|nr:HNH endonuclease signature motif containing protein [Tenacibaculum finnmarkense]MCM8906792.1 HNH endonuclease [Tenacibaculum finnmarkense genomovar finnmarkense]
MPKGYFKPFTEIEEKKLKDEFLEKPVKTLSKELGVGFGRIMRFLKSNNLEIPRELINRRISDSRKKKGDVPFNKGKKQNDYMTTEAIQRSKKTRFKKGQLPHNTKVKESGVIVKRIDNRGVFYSYIKIKHSKWRLLHRVLWEESNGEIPKDCVLIFKDGDSSNVVLENLKLITKIEHMYNNSFLNYPKEIIPSLVWNKKLENKLNNLQNG